jgi:serine/threonine protein kinase
VALARERDLLDRVKDITGVPHVRQFAAEAGRTTLAVSWPATKHGEPCRTIGAAFPPSLRQDRWHLHLLLVGFRGVAATLSKLHARGVTHRSLTPDGIIVTGTGRFALRDLGLAAQPPRPGEGPPDYRAPEQGLAPGRARPGPATDVCQLAAIVYHLVTGHLPTPRNPVPARTLNPGLPGAVSDIIAAALAPDPGNRPRLGEFRAKLTLPRAETEDQCQPGS